MPYLSSPQSKLVVVWLSRFGAVYEGIVAARHVPVARIWVDIIAIRCQNANIQTFAGKPCGRMGFLRCSGYSGDDVEEGRSPWSTRSCPNALSATSVCSMSVTAYPMVWNATRYARGRNVVIDSQGEESSHAASRNLSGRPPPPRSGPRPRERGLKCPTGPS
jgi:hypothetical protein